MYDINKNKIKTINTQNEMIISLSNQHLFI
jgi:hypothetical protein